MSRQTLCKLRQLFYGCNRAYKTCIIIKDLEAADKELCKSLNMIKGIKKIKEKKKEEKKAEKKAEIKCEARRHHKCCEEQEVKEIRYVVKQETVPVIQKVETKDCKKVKVKKKCRKDKCKNKCENK